MIAIGLALLWREVGVAAVPGVALMILFTLLSGYFGGRIVDIRKKSLAAADLRIRIISEIVQAIKLVKMLGWQQQIVSSVRRARAAETASLVSLAMIKAINITFSFVSSLLIIAATFSVYVATGDALVSVKAFTVLSLFNVLRFPLIMFPMTMKFTGECWVAFQRIEAFLEQDEVEDDPHETAHKCGDGIALVLLNCVLSWDGRTPVLQGRHQEPLFMYMDASHPDTSPDSRESQVLPANSEGSTANSEGSSAPSPTFSGISLAIPKGLFVSVVGSVGAGVPPLIRLPSCITLCLERLLAASAPVYHTLHTPHIGKSTLLCALIGSVPRLQGSISIAGRVA
jgi:ABC-type multidrug transport system fused ATPase/permease subunit